MTDKMGGFGRVCIMDPLCVPLRLHCFAYSGSSEKQIKLAGYHQPDHTSCISLIRPSTQGEYYFNLGGRSAIRVD